MEKSKGGYSCFTEATCPICGKWFAPTPEWAYNNGRSKKVCSYKCHLKARERPKSKREIAKEQMAIRDREIYMMFRAGFGYAELAERYDVGEARIRVIITQQKSLAALEGAR